MKWVKEVFMILILSFLSIFLTIKKSKYQRYNTILELRGNNGTNGANVETKKIRQNYVNQT